MNFLRIRTLVMLIFSSLLSFCNFPQLEKKVNDPESRIISELVTAKTVNGNSGENSGESSGESFTVSGNVTGIPLNETLIIQNNFSEVLSVFINGPFTFIQKIKNQSNFYISILKNPSGRNCIVQNGIGKIENSNFNGVIIICQ